MLTGKILDIDVGDRRAKVDFRASGRSERLDLDMGRHGESVITDMISGYRCPDC